jgi:ATP-dependent RNA helicase RhlE
LKLELQSLQNKTMKVINMSFDNLGLIPELLSAVESQGYTKSTPVQEKAIPAILAGRDVQAKAQTGTGKTAAFTLPMLQLLNHDKSQKPRIRGLVLLPTRELAAQVEECVQKYGKNLDLKACYVFGGVPINPQIKILKRGVDILVATPGRLLDHLEKRTMDLSQVEILILDEADRMLDMGFIRDINKIIDYLPAKRQNLLFSATYGREVKKFIRELLHNPEVIDVAGKKTAADQVKQIVHFVEKNRKRDLLSHLISSGNWEQVLVFTRTKHAANRLAHKLNRDNITAEPIHANKSQNARTRALAGFKSGEVRVLVATDIAARGIDISNLPHVVNYELPNTPKDYVHRIGRTGRAGLEGVAISLVSHDEKESLAKIEKLLNWNIKRKVITDFPRLGGPDSYSGKGSGGGGGQQRRGRYPRRRR